MNLAEFDAFCSALPATTQVVQWGDAHVWKVGGKVFAIGRAGAAGVDAFTFKVSRLSFEMLREAPGVRPAPYLASRGLSWVQHFAPPGLTDAELRGYLAQSHAMVAAGLSKKLRRALGIAD